MRQPLYLLLNVVLVLILPREFIDLLDRALYCIKNKVGMQKALDSLQKCILYLFKAIDNTTNCTQNVIFSARKLHKIVAYLQLLHQDTMCSFFLPWIAVGALSQWTPFEIRLNIFNRNLKIKKRVVTCLKRRRSGFDRLEEEERNWIHPKEKYSLFLTITLLEQRLKWFETTHLHQFFS